MTTDSLEVVAKQMVTNFENAKSDLGIEDVYYGDQAIVPRFPALCVEPIEVNRELTGIGGNGQTDNHFVIQIFIYHGPYVSTQTNREQADALCSRIEYELHTNVNLDGQIIHGFVVRNESGQADRNGFLAANRMTWEGMSKTILGAPV